jgi:hypothetical protein
MQALLTSAALVGVAEIGDKTQLLSFVLATRFRRPFPIIAGILVATLLNHALAGSIGVWLADVVPRPILNWTVSLACVGFGIWALSPDKLDKHPGMHGAGAFVTTFARQEERLGHGDNCSHAKARQHLRRFTTAPGPPPITKTLFGRAARLNPSLA